MCKEGWCVRLGQSGVAWGGGTIWNILKGSGTEKRGGETIILKMVWAGSGGGCLKRGGGWNRTMSKLIQATVNIGSLNSQDMISFVITTGSWKNQDTIRILKRLGHDFSGKHICDGYCVDITWCSCVEVNRALRICHIILFESKGPWMLKTDGLIFWGNIKYLTQQQILCCSVEKVWLVVRMPAQ